MRLSDKAYELIRHKIITLEMPPLSAIDESALMAELEIGRTPIREALQRLAAEGLVSIVPRRGIFVADISITDLQKIFELRMVLEGFCARLAAERATVLQIAGLEAVIQQLDTVSGEDTQALLAIDEQFHTLLYQAADNKLLAEVLEHLQALSFRIFYLVLNRLGSVRWTVEQHLEIIHVLQVKDGARAEALLRQHIYQFQQEIKAVL
jgi:DNA-binding GntR family transcriptional regulator